MRARESTSARADLAQFIEPINKIPLRPHRYDRSLSAESEEPLSISHGTESLHC